MLEYPDLTYIWFQSLSLDEKIDWLDFIHIQDLSSRYSSHDIKRFYRQIFDNETNVYIKRKSLEHISELTLIGAIRADFTKDFLLEDVFLTDDSFVASAKLKYLYLLFGDDPDVYREIENSLSVEDNEVASEGLFRKGLIHLFYRSGQSDDANFLREVDFAKEAFSLATSKLENRIDAQFFNLVTRFLIAVLNRQVEIANNLFNELTAILWQRQVWGWKQNKDLYEWHIHRGLENLNAITLRVSSERQWINYKKELTQMMKRFSDMTAIDTISKQFVNSYEVFLSSPSNLILDSYYRQNLSASQLRIDSVLSELDNSETELQEFLISIKSRLQGQNVKKNFPSSQLVELYRIFPDIISSKIAEDFDTLTKATTEEEAFIQLAIEYRSREKATTTSYNTGYSVGDEVLQTLTGRIKSLLPTYDPNKLAIYTGVLSEVINYAYRALTQPTIFFPHLYDATIRDEGVFHQHLYTSLTTGTQASHYHYEEADAIGKGRIDIVYRMNNMVVPIEVKVDNDRLTWGEIKKSFIAQVQTYIHPYDQLGMLVIFETSDKKKGAPLNDFRELFEILHCEPFYKIPNRFPDYTVTVIIPANKVEPSSYTKYSKH